MSRCGRQSDSPSIRKSMQPPAAWRSMHRWLQLYGLYNEKITIRIPGFGL